MLTFVTPCVLPLIPIYLALLLGNASEVSGAKSLSTRLSLFFSTIFFSMGLLIVFVSLGLTATSLGSLLTEYRVQLVLVGGLLIFLFGLKFLGVLKISFLEREKRIDDSKLKTRFHWLNALVMGVVFGAGWTPCVGPILGSVLTYTASATSDPLQGGLYLGAYGLGFVMPLLVLSLFGDAARQMIRKISPLLPKLERFSGVLLAGVGLYLMLGVTAAPAAELIARSSAPASKNKGAMKLTAIDPPIGHATSRPRMVQFKTRRCSICRQMIPTVGVIERDCDGRKVDVVKVDLDNSPKLAKDYRIRGVPTFVFLDTKGEEVARLVGYQTLGALRQSLSAVSGQQCDGLGTFKPEFEPESAPQKNSTCGGDKQAAGESLPSTGLSGSAATCGS
ncbi:MAG: sulfite exporter TauE/SafE family protein [Deltaproteobacteria bacterium]|nr:sulfite exporter TauE/SafE family protein [Deltaproteobacteria bacterium]